MKVRDEISADFLHQFDLFDGLEFDEVDRLQHLVEYRAYEPGEHVVEEGDESRDMFVLAEGSLGIYKDVDDEEPARLATLEPEAVLGELGFVLGEPRSATAVAEGEAHLLRINGEDLADRRRDGDLAAYKIEHNVLESIASRQAGMNARLLDAMEQAGGNRFERDELTDLRQHLTDEWSF